MDRALASGAKGRGFESLLARHFDWVQPGDMGYRMYRATYATNSRRIAWKFNSLSHQFLGFRLRRALSHDQFRLDHNGLRIRCFRWSINAAQQSFRRDHSHFPQWLPHGRQAGILESCALNVIEAHHGNVLRHALPRLPQRADRADRGNIIERKQRSDT